MKSRRIPIILANGSVTLEARGTKDLLDHFYAIGIGRGLRAADMVGARGDDSDLLFKLVDRVSQRLVLKTGTVSALGIPKRVSDPLEEAICCTMRWFFWLWL